MGRRRDAMSAPDGRFFDTEKLEDYCAMRIKLNCIACGHAIELGDAYEDYEGAIKCWGCSAVLEVKLLQGKLKTMKFVKITRPSADEARERTFA